MRRTALSAALTLAALAFGPAVGTLAAQAADVAVPEPLAPWVPWVLAEHPDLSCPTVDGARVCLWPGELALDLDNVGGTFRFRVAADRAVDLPLPGDATHWPRGVTLDGQPALLRRTGDSPTVALPAGNHTLAGRFQWNRLPQSLAVPLEVGRLSLIVEGKPIPRPQREASGLLWLAGREPEIEEERVALQVSRRIDDGVPVRLTVRLSLRVSGQAREIDLGDPLPPGFLPTSLESPLPVRLAEASDDGGRRLVAQLRPGEWTIEVTARSAGPVNQIPLADRPAPWPDEEYWAFDADATVRSVRIEGAPGVDPQRTPLPQEWWNLPAFRVEPGRALVLTELRRGQPPPPPDEIDVQREWWLAEAGDRFTVRDSLRGGLNTGGRLEALEPARLGRVALGREPQSQVVTVGAVSERPGVEVRSWALDLRAELVYPRSGPLPAVGWDRSTTNLAIRLNLPPGWQLLAAPGVDKAAGSLLEAWDLFDLFFLLLATLATWKLSSWRYGALTFIVLGIAWQEPYTPFLVFWWLLLLVVLALLRVLPPGRAGRLVNALRWAVAGAFAFQLVLFCTAQWRTGIFPQLEHGYYGHGRGAAPVGQPDFTTFDRLTGRVDQLSRAGLASPPLTGEFARYQASGVRSPEDEAVQAEGRLWEPSPPGDTTSAGGYRARQLDAAAVVQTGPGVPEWSWHVYSLHWSGPVSPEHRFRLLLISPGVERLLSLLRMAGTILLAFWLLDPRRHPRPPNRSAGATKNGSAGSPGTDSEGHSDARSPMGSHDDSHGGGGRDPSQGGSGSAPGPALALLVVLMSLVAAPVAAQSPASAPPATPILDELERRLTAPPACDPECVEVAALTLRASGELLRIEAEVHAAVATAWALPGPMASWAPDRVVVDGRPETALRRDAEGFLLLRLEPGVHRVELSGPAGDSLTLQMPRPPRTMRWRGDGWEIAGFRPDAPPPSSVRLNRILPATSGAQDRVELAPRLTLTRELDLGIPWLVHNRLERAGSAVSSVAVEVPLIAGESVITGGVPVDQGRAAITLERGETVRRWDSTLEERDAVTLTAPEAPWLERWELSCSPIFTCRAEGLAPSRRMREVPEGATWSPLWLPWPGESLTVFLDRPAPAPGATTTVDAVGLEVSPGRRLLAAQLTLEMRSSQGGERRLTLPEGAQLQSFRINEKDQPIQLEDRVLAFTVEPGSHEIDLRWRQPQRLGLTQRAPAVALGSPAANVTVRLTVPSNRWLLWASGPSWGSEVTLWLYLPLIALAALALGRWRVTPLSRLDWLLLGLGLTQVHLVFAAIVVLWLIVFGLRDRLRAAGRWRRRFHYLLLGALWLAALGVLYAVVHIGLLGRPEMQIAGLGGGGNILTWYRDLVPGELPRPWVLWLPLWVFRGLMLAWALWLAHRLLSWLPWAWVRLTSG